MGNQKKYLIMLRKIRNAIVSVNKKEDLTPVLKVLKKYKINIISSGGTYKYIKKRLQSQRSFRIYWFRRNVRWKG